MEKGKHAKSFWNKKIILLVSLLLILVIGVGGTTAWLTSKGGSPTYPMKGAMITEQVHYYAYVNDKYQVRVQNTHPETVGYVRSRLVFTWVNKAGGEGQGQILNDKEVLAAQPVYGQDYLIHYDFVDEGGRLNATDWVYNENDGYYYYTQRVAPLEYTTPLIGQTDKLHYGGNYAVNVWPLRDPPEGYRLELCVVSDIIQAAPSENYQQAWGRTVASYNSANNTVSFLDTIPNQNVPTRAQ